ncbi:MAG: type IV pilin-like G/H family protein [Cyanobacteria bacterium P01_D01_bin.44]
MKTILYRLSGKHTTQDGFTLIELLVVIIVLGILSAIALPSFLSQASKAKQSEGRTYVGSMNRAQQAYYLENSRFANDMDLLGTGLQTQTANYDYSIVSDSPNLAYVLNAAKPRLETIKGYYGPTKIGPNSSSAIATLTTLCEAKAVGTAPFTAAPTYNNFGLGAGVNSVPKCANDFKGLN